MNTIDNKIYIEKAVILDIIAKAVPRHTFYKDREKYEFGWDDACKYIIEKIEKINSESEK